MSKFVLVFLAFLVSGLTASLFRDARWGVYVYEIVYFLNPPSRWWYGHLPDLRYSFSIAVVIFISFGLRLDRYRENKIFDVPQTKWILLNLINFSLISLWAVWPERHQPSLINHIKILIFLYIAYKTIDTPEKFEKMIWAFLFGNFYLGWVGKAQGRSFGGRMEGFGPSDSGGDGNNTAAILISSVPLLLHYIMNKRGWQRLITLLFLAYVMNAVILVNSRGSFVGLIIAGVYYFSKTVIFNSDATTKERVKFLGIVSVGICLFLYLTDATFWERMSTLQGEAGSEMAGAGRPFFWKKTFWVMERYPFGVGTWGYQFLSPLFIPEEFLTGGRRAVHSLYFQCLAERGYHGFMIFMALLISNFMLLWKVKKHLSVKNRKVEYSQAIALESGLIAFLAAAIFLNRLHAEILYWFMMFIAAFGNIYLVKGFDNRLNDIEK